MDEIRDGRLSEGCEPVRTTLRVVGFKVADYSPSPTSVLAARESQSTRTDSPRSKLAEALKIDTFHPLPRLRLKSTPRPQVPGFRKSLSHADLQLRDLVHLPSELSEATTPGSRASSSSTPMKIPSTMTRVHTCPIELSEFAGATFKAAIQLPGTLPSGATTATHAHVRRSSEISSSSCRSIEEVDNDSLARDLFQVASVVTADQNPACASEEEEQSDCTTFAADAAVDFVNLQVNEPSNNAVPPPLTKLKLRLPAAAVHRRGRSLEASLPRPSS